MIQIFTLSENEYNRGENYDITKFNTITIVKQLKEVTHKDFKSVPNYPLLFTAFVILSWFFESYYRLQTSKWITSIMLMLIT